MATTVDDLVVKFSADVSNLTKGVDKGTASLAKLEKRAQVTADNFSRSLRAMVSTTAILAAGAAFLRMGSDVEKAALGLQSLADSTHVSISALQDWRYAATQSGASAENMDAALVNLDKAIGEARAGSEEAAKYFKALGLDELIKKGASTEAIFLALADALEQIEDPTKADAFALKLLGTNSDRLHGLIRQGSAAFHEYGRELEKTGGKISDSLNKELVESAKETAKLDAQFGVFAANAWAATQKVIIGLGLLISKTKGAIDELSGLDWLQKNVEGAEGYHQNDTWSGNNPFESMFGRQSSSDMLQGFRSNYKTPPPPPKLNLNGSGSGRDDAAEAIKREQRAIRDLIRDLEFEHSIIGVSAEQQAVMNNLRGLGASATEEQRVKVEAWTRANFEAQEQLQKLAELEQFAADIRVKYGEGTEQLTQHIQRLNDALAQGLINAQEFSAAMDDALKTDETRDMEASWKAIGDQAKAGLADVMVEVAANTDAAAESMERFAQEILKAIAKMLILKAIEAGVNAIFGGAGGSSGGKAMGGLVNPGNAYMVGERGPELFLPNVGGNIVPNNRLGSSGGAMSFTYNISAPGADAGTLMKMRMMLDAQKRDIFDIMPKYMDEKTRRSKMFMTKR